MIKMKRQKVKCICCRKELLPYKAGFCQYCYRYYVTKHYVLKDNTKIYNTWFKEALNEILNTPNVKLKDIAKKYNQNIENVRYAVKAHCEIRYTYEIK